MFCCLDVDSNSVYKATNATYLSCLLIEEEQCWFEWRFSVICSFCWGLEGKTCKSVCVFESSKLNIFTFSCKKIHLSFVCLLLRSGRCVSFRAARVEVRMIECCGLDLCSWSCNLKLKSVQMFFSCISQKSLGDMRFFLQRGQSES